MSSFRSIGLNKESSRTALMQLRNKVPDSDLETLLDLVERGILSIKLPEDSSAMIFRYDLTKQTDKDQFELGLERGDNSK